MRKLGLPIVTITALSVGMLFAATNMTSAQQAAKKLTYEQAWAFCKQQVTSVLGTNSTTSAGRYTRRAACMREQGYRLRSRLSRTAIACGSGMSGSRGGIRLESCDVA